MSAARTLAMVAATVAALLGAAPAAAQVQLICGNAPAFDLSTATLAPDSPLRRLYPTNAWSGLERTAGAGKLEAAVDSLRSWFEATGVPARRPQDAAVMIAQLDTLGRILAEDASLHDAVAHDWPARDYNVAPPTPGRPSYRIFGLAPHPIDVGRNDDEADAMAFCWTAISASDLLGRFRDPAFQGLLKRYQTALARWYAYNETGRSQYPWELFLNGLRVNKLELEPRRLQLIMFHPWLGIEADFIDAVRSYTIVPIDGIGFIHYYSEDFKRYWGLSAAAILSERDPRFGLMLHLTGGFSLGPTVGIDGSLDGLGIAVTVDFLKAATGLPGAQRLAERLLEEAIKP